MNEELRVAICEQINAEFYSEYLYLSMSEWAQFNGWKGISNWLHVQSQEEKLHAIAIYNHLVERGVRTEFSAIAKPPSEWESPTTLFQDVSIHEAKVTEGINNLATIAMKYNDHAFYQFIQFFIKEQIEEEASTSDITTRLKRLEGHPALMDAIDIELGKRVLVNSFTTN